MSAKTLTRPVWFLLLAFTVQGALALLPPIAAADTVPPAPSHCMGEAATGAVDLPGQMMQDRPLLMDHADCDNQCACCLCGGSAPLASGFYLLVRQLRAVPETPVLPTTRRLDTHFRPPITLIQD